MNAIKNRLKSAISFALKRKGYEIKRRVRPVDELTSLEIALSVLLSTKRVITIAQVGANDGRLNDPIYSFAYKYPERTRLILIEPQAELIPYLESNYSFHNQASIYRGAVGTLGRRKLYSVGKAYWPYVRAEYAKDWPSYRAPTGVTSENRIHVENWIAKYVKGKPIAADSIMQNEVDFSPLGVIIEKIGAPIFIDLLQIDAEGFDDEVIYNSDIGRLRPIVINFESENLSADRQSILLEYLNSCGYILTNIGKDSMAVRIEC
jgi:FkbM family methyltransferase